MNNNYFYKQEGDQYVICHPDGKPLTTEKGNILYAHTTELAELLVKDLNQFNIQEHDGVYWKKNSPACSLIGVIIDCDDEEENFGAAKSPLANLNLPDNHFAVFNIAESLEVDPQIVNNWLSDRMTTDEFYQKHASHVDPKKLQTLKKYLEIVRNRH